ncbi:hypothetical protein MSAN_00908800 [Mycena sanguinolenta]|uniref:Uncharacterized protein n=1 Tax=Mycena sanguinolenta TaxID=230812 RepID=A0A8H6YZ89_9AGAR|nr:hypothetical protein MSAN_00908800 [Mycena sanguinolenta]
MPAIAEEAIFTAASETPTKAVTVLVVIAAAASVIYAVWPSRLIPILLSAMREASKVYAEAYRMGLRSSDETEMSRLRRKVSNVIDETHRNAESWPAALYDFLCGRTFTLLYSIYEVKSFGARITMLKEVAQLRIENNLPPWPQTTQQLGHSFRDYAGSWWWLFSACLCRLRRSFVEE